MKLIVAQTVPEMRVCADLTANHYLNNVRVNGIVAAEGVDPLFLMGVLNGAPADFVFRRIAKPKMGGYYEANKQFIAPLPIPDVEEDERAEIAAMAGELQRLWSSRRALLEAASGRLSVLARARHDERWLWPDIPTFEDFEARAPSALKTAGERQEWARSRHDEAIAVKFEALQARLESARSIDPVFENGELALFGDGARVLDHIYLDEAAGALTEAYWRWLFLSRTWRDADSLARELRRPPAGAETPAARQFIDQVAELAADTAAIVDAEQAINLRLFELYQLSDAERVLVENNETARAGA